MGRTVFRLRAPERKETKYWQRKAEEDEAKKDEGGSGIVLCKVVLPGQDPEDHRSDKAEEGREEHSPVEGWARKQGVQQAQARGPPKRLTGHGYHLSREGMCRSPRTSLDCSHAASSCRNTSDQPPHGCHSR